MVREFKFPDVGEGVTEGTLLKWLIEEGDPVEEDESLAEVETDKAVVEVPSPVDGTVLKLHAEEGELIKVGNVIVTLGEGDETADDIDTATAEDTETAKETTEGAQEAEQKEEPEPEHRESSSVVGELPEEEQETDEPDEAEKPAAEQPAEPPAAASGGPVMAAPSTRRLAREKGIDIAAVDGSGSGGRITREDVMQAAEGGAETPPQKTRESGSTGGHVLATPATRNLANELGVDISSVSGTGPGGRITEEDVRTAAESGTAAQEPEQAAEPTGSAGGNEVGPRGGLQPPQRFEAKEYDFEKYGSIERVEMSGTRRAIAKQMTRSKYTAPHVTSMDEADVTELWDYREQEKEVAASRDVHLTFLPFIVKALISALRDYPMMNASLDEQTGEVVKKEYYNIGVAVATENGLMVPNVKDADRKSVLRIAKEINELAEKARDHSLKLDEMRGGTFTITNYGSIGGTYGTPVINYPEVGILGTGTINQRIRVVDGEVKIRRVLPLSVTFDHRVVDGAYVAQFMNELIKHLEDPDLLLLDD